MTAAPAGAAADQAELHAVIGAQNPGIGKCGGCRGGAHGPDEFAPGHAVVGHGRSSRSHADIRRGSAWYPPLRMTEIDQLLQEFPPAVRERLRQAWEKMPEAARGPLTAALRELPGDLGRWRELMLLALSHVRMVTGTKRRVAIVGPANVGKSTLYNQLVRNAADAAEVSAVPGTTRVSQTADAGLF